MMPTLHDGDIVLVDLGRRTPTPPGVFVLYDGMGLLANGWTTHHQQRSAASPHHFG